MGSGHSAGQGETVNPASLHLLDEGHSLTCQAVLRFSDLQQAIEQSL